MKLTIALLVSVTLVTSCAPTGPTSNCAGWKAIRLSGAGIDGLPQTDAQAVLAHNEYGRARCGW
jgi:hypothetical protein